MSEIREKEIFDNKVVLAGWFLDKSLSLLPSMKNDHDKKHEARKIIRLVHEKHQKIHGIPAVETIETPEAAEPLNEFQDPFDSMLSKLEKASSSSQLNRKIPTTSDDLGKEIKEHEMMAPPLQRLSSVKWWKENEVSYTESNCS